MLRVAVFVSLVLHFVLLSILQVPKMPFEVGSTGQGLMRVQLTSALNFETVHSLPLPGREPGNGYGEAKPIRRMGEAVRTHAPSAPPPVRWSIDYPRDGSLYADHPSVHASPPSPNRMGEGLDLAALSMYRLAIAQTLRKSRRSSSDMRLNEGRTVAVTVSIVSAWGAPRASLVRPSGEQGVDRSLLSMIESAIAACPPPESLNNVPFELLVILEGGSGEN